MAREATDATDPRWLVRFGYDGAGFAGWARQPGRRTVEGTIRAALGRLALPGTEGGTLEVASRTDAGVSARANALTLPCALPGRALLRALNGAAPEIFFTAARRVDRSFRVRSAEGRIYRYYLSGDRARALRLNEAIGCLGGAVDARSFARDVRGELPRMYPLASIRTEEDPGGLYLEIRAPRFAWGMVRKIVGALAEWEAGRLSATALRAAASGRERRTLPLAAPEPLVLWSVDYPGTWEFQVERPLRHQREHFERGALSAATRARTLRAISPSASLTGPASHEAAASSLRGWGTRSPPTPVRSYSSNAS